ncbi:MAG TPA: branched-chain amino acid ABC transporter permease [Nitrososphaerales archaeon]|nr:branched-chain amino acid ABC transporter permease [Nitrososphaerales archaeon]
MAFGASDLLQSIVTGLLQGGFFALAAVGLSLIFGVQKILNVAHGSFVILAAFITIQFSIILTPLLHIDPLLSLVLDVPIMAGFGAAAYYAVIYKIENKGFEAPLLATFGLSILIEYAVSNGLGPIPAIDPSRGIGAEAQNQIYSSSSWQLGSIFLNEANVIAFLIAIVVVPALQIFLSRTYYGRAIRATSQDWEAAEFSGIDTRRTRLLSFVIGSATTGLAGGLFAFTTSVTPDSGDVVLLPIILEVIILGGVGSIIGTLAGGFFVGLVMNISSLLVLELPSQYGLHADLGGLITFLIFIIVLMVRPTGLFGRGATR